MEKKTVILSDAFDYAITSIKRHPWYLILPGILTAIPLIGYFFQFGYIKLLLKYYDTEYEQKRPFRVLESGFTYILPALAIDLVVILLLIPSYAFFIIPGLILSARLTFTYWIMVDQNTGIWKSIERSNHLVRGCTFPLVIFNFIAALVFSTVIGLIFFPVIMLAKLHIYRQLKSDLPIFPPLL